MSQSGYTPIQLYRTTTASATPSAGNLSAGELAINLTDEKLYFKNAGGTVKTLASSGTSSIGGSNTQVQYNSSGVLSGSSNLVFDGTNLGIGDSSFAYRLVVGGDLRIAGGGGDIRIQSATGTTTAAGDSQIYNDANNMIFATGTTTAERMRINSSGNVGIGTSSPSSLLDVNGNAEVNGTLFLGSSNHGNLASDSNTLYQRGNNIAFQNAAGSGTYAYIDSSGNLLVGTTNTGTSNSNSLTLEPGNGYAVVNHSGTASGTGYAVFGYNGSLIGSITQNGTTGVLYNITSDTRLKHDIVDAPEASSLIDAIKIRSFKWNTDNSEQRYGVVAQELVEVAPEAVSQPVDPEEMMGVDYSKLVPLMIKEIQSLRARVAQLEGK